jgi:phospholipase C
MRAALTRAAGVAALVTLACACSGSGGGGVPASPTPVPTRTTSPPSANPPTHVVVIVQENRSFDNLFNGYPGAQTQDWGLDQHGNHIPLVPVALNAPFDVEHEHSSFVTEFDGGRMDGWSLVHTFCTRAPCTTQTPYSYVRPSDIKPYWALAEQFGLADEMLQSNEGPSFAAHQYLIAGQSGHPWAMAGIPDKPTAGCGVPGATVAQINMDSAYPGMFGGVTSSCKNYPTVLDLLINKGLTWRYYTPFPTYLYNAPYASQHIYFGPTASNDVTPEWTILSDIKAHALANVTYLVSRVQLTDHPGLNDGDGPYWIATVTNAIFTNPYYAKNTVVLVTWDDWGGLYDDVAPRHPDGMPTDPYEYGFRVPLLVVSPFVKTPHLVDHTPRDQTAIVHFIETTFGLPSLGELDAKTDDLSSMFDFTRTPLPYTKIDTNGWVPTDAMRFPATQGED